MKLKHITAASTGEESEENRTGGKQTNIATQIRLPDGIHNYIKQEACRMGISQNAFMVILLEQGKKLWEAKISICPGE